MWSMLPQPGPVGSSMGQQTPSGSSMGGAPPSRSPGPAGGTNEQWSEIFPAQPDFSAGLKERGWAAHLRSAAWAARVPSQQQLQWGVQCGSCSIMAGGITTQPGAVLLCQKAAVRRLSTGHLSAAQGLRVVLPAWCQQGDLTVESAPWQVDPCPAPLPARHLLFKLLLRSCPDVQTSGAGPSAQPLHAASGNCTVAAVPARAG